MPQLPQKMTINSKLVEIDPKPKDPKTPFAQFKSATHSVWEKNVFVWIKMTNHLGGASSAIVSKMCTGSVLDNGGVP